VSATLLVGEGALSEGEIQVAGEEFRHLFRARRLTVGEGVRVVDGLGRARFSTVLRVSRSAAVLEVGEDAPSNEPSRRVEILVGALRPQRASWLVEKATEVGVYAVRFIASERAPRRFGTKTLERLCRVARSAVEQSGRARLPEISGVHKWTEVAELIDGLESRWVLEPGHTTETQFRTPGKKSVALLVGPEGGFSAGEKSLLEEQGCRPSGLGPRILRVETAALVGAAALLVGVEAGRGKCVSSSVDTL